MSNDEQLHSGLRRFLEGAITRCELENILGNKTRFHFWDTNQRSVDHLGLLPKVLFTREDVDRELKRFLAKQISALDLSDWAATLRLLNCFEFEERDPVSSEIWDLIDELISPDAWGLINVDSVIDLRRRLSEI
jgi:hypothetical protein